MPSDPTEQEERLLVMQEAGANGCGIGCREEPHPLLMAARQLWAADEQTPPTIRATEATFCAMWLPSTCP